MTQISNKAKSFNNPILPGFYPDPSICRVGEDYYLVNSSFTYYPGIPIFHSRDLVHWKQLGHVLNRPSQLDLKGLDHSLGIFAPTIRYHNGTFYVITTNVGSIGNFIVTAKDPAGPWSEPYILKDAPGIDPSLFFDDDGRAYYTGTAAVPEGEEYFGDNEIWLRELDLETMQLKGPRFGLWRGALKRADWPEGPHLYKINDYYYLMIAEGGTDYHHSVTIARSRSLTGPYEGNPANPILTHRHLGRSYPIVNAGHADLVETQNGEWWMVALASRPYGGYYRNLGRETFLTPVVWEDGWPVVSPGTGRIEQSYLLPDLPEVTVKSALIGVSVKSALLEVAGISDLPTESAGSGITAQADDDYAAQSKEVFDHFDKPVLGWVWNLLRTPEGNIFSLKEKESRLRLKLRPETITEKVNPSFVGRRQQHFCFTASTALEFRPQNESEAAGLVLLQNNDYQFRLEYGMSDGKGTIHLIKREAGHEELLARREYEANPLYLRVTADGQEYSFYYGDTAAAENLLAGNINGRILSTDVAGGFVGAYIGMYASSRSSESSNFADFDWFRYSGV